MLVFSIFSYFGEKKTLQSGEWTCNFLKIRQILVQNVNFGLFYHIQVADEPYKVGVESERCSKLGQFCSICLFSLFSRILVK